VPAGEFTVQADGIIKEIGNDPLHKTILVETANGEILLHVSDDTLMAAAFADYSIDDRIRFTHSMAMTMSIPPQTTVYTISVPKTPR
jgi:hypothetical protein